MSRAAALRLLFAQLERLQREPALAEVPAELAARPVPPPPPDDDPPLVFIRSRDVAK